MNKYKIITLTFTLFISCISVFAQKDSIKFEGLVVDPYRNSPIEGAIVNITGHEPALKTDKDGKFFVKLISKMGIVSVWYPGYYTDIQPIANRTKIKFVLISEDKSGYADNMLLPF